FTASYLGALHIFVTDEVMGISSPRYGWWGYVKSIIRRYPQLAEEYKGLQSQSITPAYSAEPGAHKVSRSTEEVALRELPPVKQREYTAVRLAVEATERHKDGRDRLAVVRMVFWDRTHTLQGAAMQIPCSNRTAERWHGEFIRVVASNFGLMD
ncbi:MAG: hypothetical protein RSB39_07950, partial [Oscillospiraceae bacterium]